MTHSTFPWFQHARQWLARSPEQLPPVGLDDTQVFPAVTNEEPLGEAADVDEKQAAEIAVRWQHQPAHRQLDPSDPSDLNTVLEKLRRWNP